MQEYQNTFYSYLKSYQREKALGYTVSLLDDAVVSVVQLYEDIIKPSMGRITICRAEEHDKIWKEHVMTQIARTVVECCAPYVLKQKNPLTQKNSESKVVILCPEEEYHDIGARMGADYFILENYQVIFVGGNTPKSNILSLCGELKPQWLAISTSNFFHLAAVKDVISEIKTLPNSPQIILSGSAFSSTGMTAHEFGAFTLVQNYQQVQELGGVKK